MKKVYLSPKAELVVIENDVITASGGFFGDDLEFITPANTSDSET